MNESQDHSSLLPPELLGRILNHVQGPDQCIVNPISKRFLPFQREVLYRRVIVRSYEQLDKLCWTVENQPDIVSDYVKGLKIDIEPKFRQNSPRITEIEDPQSPSSKQLRQLFSALDELNDLYVNGSSRIASMVLSPQVSISSLPKLSILSLSSSFRGFDDPFNPTFYAPLLNYTNLDEFTLWVYRTSAGIVLSPKSPPVISPCLPSLFSLTLKGPLSTSCTSVQRLISSFGFIFQLELTDTSSSTCRIFNLLGDLECPGELSHLSLQRYSIYGPAPQGSIVDALGELSSLESLVVGGTTSSLSPDFYEALLNLPLTMLVFGSEADVNLVELEKLVTGPKRHETLKTIWFENVEGEMGTKIMDIGGEPWTGPNGDGWGPYPDWQLPE
ncbi:uncharacterized protein JCM6883_005472 [Sporobolomyces salmoneus]|uniref:uncharacterized protein n=1 Tax=Sporobolomyces salmoneus TaxID=183962 RepID=UPI0031713F51